LVYSSTIKSVNNAIQFACKIVLVKIRFKYRIIMVEYASHLI